MTVYKYFLKLTNRYKIYGIIYLVIFMGMALLQISKIDERKHFEDVPVKMMIKDESNGSNEIINRFKLFKRNMKYKKRQKVIQV